MADEPQLLNHISAQLAAIEATLQALVVDVATLKAGGKGYDSMAVDLREQGQRLSRLELQAASWGGGGGVAGKVGAWAAGIVASLLVIAVAGVVGYFVRHP